MHYQRFDPTDCGFPKSRVPILPTLSWQALRCGDATRFRPLGLSGNAQTFTCGRYALTEAYRLAWVGPNAAVLISAYHCRTMLDPAIRLGAPIVLYGLLPDLSPDKAALARSLAQSPHPVTALLLTHYFGFAQALSPIVDFCMQDHITLIEDCSHALSINANSAANARGQDLVMGQTGRFGVATPTSFVPAKTAACFGRTRQMHPLWPGKPLSPLCTA